MQNTKTDKQTICVNGMCYTMSFQDWNNIRRWRDDAEKHFPKK